jgi:transcriptional regulator GlxA family with amidase domain
VKPRHVGIVIFPEAEVLDVAGPFEVFSVTGRRHGLDLFHVSLIAELVEPVPLRNGFRLTPHYTLETAPPVDLLVVPGGYGTRREIDNPDLVEWIRRAAGGAELALSVCTGALLLAKAGLLDGIDATTHHQAIALLRELAPTARVRPGERFIDNGRVIVSAGVSAGLDMSLHVVERLHGYEVAQEAASYMEYHWDRNEEGLNDEGV